RREREARRQREHAAPPSEVPRREEQEQTVDEVFRHVFELVPERESRRRNLRPRAARQEENQGRVPDRGRREEEPTPLRRRAHPRPPPRTRPRSSGTSRPPRRRPRRSSCT